MRLAFRGRISAFPVIRVIASILRIHLLLTPDELTNVAINQLSASWESATPGRDHPSM